MVPDSLLQTPWVDCETGSHLCRMAGLAGRVRLFHYTSHEGLRGILAEGVIMPSFLHGHPTGWVGGRDVTAGAVFLTEKDPDTYSREMIAYNNYGLGWNKSSKWEKVEACLEVEVLPGPWVVKDKHINPERNVIAWLHPRGLVLWQPDPWSWEGRTLLTPYQVSSPHLHPPPPGEVHQVQPHRRGHAAAAGPQQPALLHRGAVRGGGQGRVGGRGGLLCGGGATH